MFPWPAEARHIYLSPHLDDAALSCGGMITTQAARGEQIAVITIFAGSPQADRPLSPFAQSLHRRWQEAAPLGLSFRDPSMRRREEDLHALAELGGQIQVLHGHLGDCIYRTDRAGRFLYASEEAIFGQPNDSDPAWELIQERPALQAGQIVYAPLAVGGHVDHRITRQIVERWRLPPAQVRFYEDYPYAEKPGAVEMITDGSSLRLDLIPLDEAALAAKIRSVACYDSQISTFWPDLHTMGQALRGYAAHRGGEALWFQPTA